GSSASSADRSSTSGERASASYYWVGTGDECPPCGAVPACSGRLIHWSRSRECGVSPHALVDRTTVVHRESPHDQVTANPQRVSAEPAEDRNLDLPDLQEIVTVAIGTQGLRVLIQVGDDVLELIRVPVILDAFGERAASLEVLEVRSGLLHEKIELVVADDPRARGDVLGDASCRLGRVECVPEERSRGHYRHEHPAVQQEERYEGEALNGPRGKWLLESGTIRDQPPQHHVLERDGEDGVPPAKRSRISHEQEE